MKETANTYTFTTKDYTNLIRKYVAEYNKANRSKKSELLSHLEVVTLRSRDSIARTLRQTIRGKSYSTERLRKHVVGARGRPILYTPEVDQALEEIWQAYNCPCADRLHPQVARAIEIFKRDNEWHYDDKVTSLLLRMPLNTMRPRLVKMAHKHSIERGFTTTQASRIKELVPTFHGNWNTMPVGYGQIDTVVHAGGELYGDMVYTVSFIDMQTYWQEFVAQYTKTAEVTLASVKIITERLPFPLKGLHPDSGDEFLNWLLLEWCRNPERHLETNFDIGIIDLTRSRPNKKNDNCNVEERNKHIIREYIGYGRYDCLEAVTAMNELYSVLRLYVNYFQPIQKLEGYRQNSKGKRRRKYSEAKTPFERVLEHPDTSDQTKALLIAEYQRLNPKHLLAKIKALTIKLKNIQRQQDYND